MRGFDKPLAWGVLALGLLVMDYLSGPVMAFPISFIRDAQQQWQPIETYISDRSEAKFTHSVCPECARANYPDIFGAAGLERL